MLKTNYFSERSVREFEAVRPEPPVAEPLREVEFVPDDLEPRFDAGDFFIVFSFVGFLKSNTSNTCNTKTSFQPTTNATFYWPKSDKLVQKKADVMGNVSFKKLEFN